ncbi:MAG: DHH family phosphoesterase [Lachnospiraceae bacterium]|nr:DHH family phosphoesterase [Lachnospiraceae bacterium]
MNPRDLIKLCKNKKIYIQTHNFPDPDAISSAFGIQKLLEFYGIESEICHLGQIDKLSSIKLLDLCDIKMNAYEDIEHEMSEESMILLVDCQKNNGNTTDIKGHEFAAVDHHPTVVEEQYDYFDLRIVGACASIVADYYRQLDIKPDYKVATALIYGIRMDTNQLSRGVTELDIDIFGYLYNYIDRDLLTSLENNNMELSDLRAYGAAIEHISLIGRVGFSYMNFSCPDALVAILSDFILSISGIDFVVIYDIRNDGYKFSVRSECSDVHAGKLTKRALTDIGNGGGHASMAGGYVERDKVDLFREGFEYRDDEYSVKKLKVTNEEVFKLFQNIFIDAIRQDYPKLLEE